MAVKIALRFATQCAAELRLETLLLRLARNGNFSACFDFKVFLVLKELRGFLSLYIPSIFKRRFLVR